MKKNIEEKLVSVIMATYNEEVEWIKQSIESILNQSYENIEFIIVNDNPNNMDIINLLEKYSIMDKRIKIIFNKENIGLVKSLNKALKIANGEFIVRMDSDDISDLKRIEKQIFVLENYNIDIVMSNASIIDEKNILQNNNLVTPCKMRDIKRLLKYKNVCIHPTWAFKKYILKDLKYYNDCKYVEDYDFICRAIIKGYKIQCIQENLLKYRIRSTSVCNSNRLEQQINFQLVNSNYIYALKHREDHFKMEKINIDKCKVNSIKRYKERLELSSDLINSGKNVRGKMIFYTNFFSNKYKRRQLLNEIKYTINNYILNLF